MNHLAKVSEQFAFKGRVRWIKTRVGTKDVIAVDEWKSNLLMFGSYTGRDIILKQLQGDTTAPMALLWCDIGTSSTAPVITDTQLGAAVLRTLLPVITQVSNSVTFSFFFADANLANGTYPEIGTGTGGTSAVNTGSIMNHALFATALVKGTGEDITCQIDFSI